MPEPDPFLRAARRCPRCGAREPTLGPTCPACGRAYDARSWVDRAPLGDHDGFADGPAAMVVVPLVALLNILLSGAWALLTWPIRALVRRWSGGGPRLP